MSAGHQHHTGPFPRGALAMAAAMIAFAILSAAAVRTGLIPIQSSPAAHRAEAHVTAVTSRDLRFTDRADGAVVIEDAGRGTVNSVIIPGQKTGFIRGVMRGLARERRMHNIGSGPAFRLTSWSDGELSLIDLATGRTLELNAYGPSNRASFAALLAPEQASPRIATQ
jgi:putative photosynthetic complex assembly protein